MRMMDEVTADVVFSQGCPDSCISYTVKSLFKIDEGIVDVLLAFSSCGL